MGAQWAATGTGKVPADVAKHRRRRFENLRHTGGVETSDQAIRSRPHCRQDNARERRDKFNDAARLNGGALGLRDYFAGAACKSSTQRKPM